MKSLVLSCALAICGLVAVPAVASAGHFHGPYYQGGYVQVARPVYHVQPVVHYAPVQQYHYAPSYYRSSYRRPRYYGAPRYYGGYRHYGRYRTYGYRGGVSVNIGW